MAIETTLDTAPPTGLRGMLRALWGSKVGDSSIMQLIGAVDGALYVAPRAFAPSAYSGNKSATTTVTGQSEAIAAGATVIRVHNLDATNYATIAFGADAATAESNASSGVTVGATQVALFSVPNGAAYVAWLGNTGTVALNLVQGN